MRTIFTKYSWIIIMVLLAFGCSKNNSNPNASLQFTILDDNGNAADNATVYLYLSENDYLYNHNLVASQVTDVNGIAIFTGLRPVAYYYYIDKSSDCASNYFTTYYTGNTLAAGVTNYISVLINETGQINFNNYSSDPYYVYFNNNLWGTVNGKSKSVATVKPGVYNIHIKQASGYATYPLEEDFKATIATCGTGDVNFP